MIDIGKLDDETVCFTLVGLYLHHWAEVEQAVNEAIGNALDLDYMQMVATTANISFVNKVNILQSAIALATFNEKQQKKYHTVLDGLMPPYGERCMVAHSQFGPMPHQRGVTFFKNGVKKKVSLQEVYWNEDACISRIEALVDKTEEVNGLSLELERRKAAFSSSLARLFVGPPQPYGAKRALVEDDSEPSP
ncbi:hypothetical protein C0V73_09805 [Rhizobium sp. TH135]|uniref:hypothetical protein n=1 Tax=Rhizobium sp. TH135 TaxID=2067451 RepID=UPI000C7BA1B9|nr:hypothetical protein [Rhizobium sp. TH135]PLK70913.1 hypothetical protein C0V73_09805 [Rhizobium sp. TH135]